MIAVALSNSLVNGHRMSLAELPWDLLDIDRAVEGARGELCVPLRGEYQGRTVLLTARFPAIPMKVRGAWHWFPRRPGWAWLSNRRAILSGTNGAIERRASSCRYECRVAGEYLCTVEGERRLFEAWAAMDAVERAVRRAERAA